MAENEPRLGDIYQNQYGNYEIIAVIQNAVIMETGGWEPESLTISRHRFDAWSRQATLIQRPTPPARKD